MWTPNTGLFSRYPQFLMPRFEIYLDFPPHYHCSFLFRCNSQLFTDILAGCSFDKRVCEFLLPANHPSREIAVYNKTVSWKRTNSLVNILHNNKLALSNIDMAKNAHRQHRTKKLKISKTNSLFNQLNSSRASWLSWKPCDFESSGTRFKFHHGQLCISLSLCFSK